MHWFAKAGMIGLYRVAAVVTCPLAGIGCGAAQAMPPAMSAQSDSRTPQNISGVWWARNYSKALHPIDGSAIPFTAQGAADYAKIKADLASGKLVDQARHTCLPQGTPRIMTTVYPFMIVQTPGQISMIFEENRMYRTVGLDAKHADPELWDPSFMGESIGHWAGDTLVVDTTNFKSTTFLDDSGLPHSDKLDVIERLSRPRGGAVLEDQVTVTDPVMFTKPWTARLSYAPRPDVAIATDWVCGEPHRSTSMVKGAPRS